MHSRWLDNEKTDNTTRESFARDAELPVQQFSRDGVQNEDITPEHDDRQEKTDSCSNFNNDKGNVKDDSFELITLDRESSELDLKSIKSRDVCLTEYLNNHNDEEDSFSDERDNLLFALD